MWIERAQDCVKWRALALAMFIITVLPPENQLFTDICTIRCTISFLL
jgi:hypothetical protein